MRNFIKKQHTRINLWMRYNPPGALSMESWNDFNKEFKQCAPVRYWLTTSVRRRIRFFFNKIDNAKAWLKYRTVNQLHVVKTKLPPGYIPFETRMLHANFEMLRDFVECDQSMSYYPAKSEVIAQSFCEKYIPFYRVFFPYRDAKIGLEFLNWSASLDDPALPPNERSDAQAKSAREIRELYLWWTEGRNLRSLSEIESYTGADLTTRLAHLQAIEDRQAEWDLEDEAMLIRLIKIRQTLWT